MTSPYFPRGNLTPLGAQRRYEVERDDNGDVVLSDAERAQTARAIINAAAKARGEASPTGDREDDLPDDPAARAIILAGRKRRNE